MQKGFAIACATALSACAATAVAQDDPAVPKICYADISAQQACTEDQIAWASEHSPQMLRQVLPLRAKWQDMRKHLPDAIKRYGANSVEKDCAEIMRQDALISEGHNATLLETMGGDVSGCRKALKMLQ